MSNLQGQRVLSYRVKVSERIRNEQFGLNSSWRPDTDDDELLMYQKMKNYPVFETNFHHVCSADICPLKEHHLPAFKLVYYTLQGVTF